MIDSINVWVYTGHWIDHDYTNILGNRFTLSSRHALILIAFVSLFDALVGNVAWSLLAHLIHQSRATNHAKDALHHQEQALLRNTGDPFSFARQLTQVGWEWRGKTRAPLRRTCTLSLTAVFISLLFSAAGILSSQIASTGNVLIRSSTCAQIEFTADPTNSQLQELFAATDRWTADLMNRALAYAQNCYNNTLVPTASATIKAFSPLANCDFYVKPTLGYTLTYGNSCPFGDTCLVPDSDVIKLDTGLLNSHFDFGINQPEENRILVRKIETCSPIISVGFSNSSYYNIAAPNGTLMAATYAYGYNEEHSNAIANHFIDQTNDTFIYLQSAYEAGQVAYDLSVASVTVYSPQNPGFFPLPELLESPNSPLSMFFLPNRVSFVGNPVNDPWFKATTMTNGSAGVFYHSEEPGRVLACLEQAQFCNPNVDNGNLCSEPDEWWLWASSSDSSQLANLSSRLQFNDMQTTTTFNLLAVLQASTFGALVSVLGQNSLQATQLLEGQVQLDSQDLQDNQWQIEMENWMLISLAFLQQATIEGVTGPDIPFLLGYMTPYPANDTVDISLCNNQKIKSTAYQSFSVVGIGLNFAVGGAIMLATLLVRDILPRLSRRISGKTSYRLWRANGLLQLQRMVYERRVEWEGQGAVPLVKGYEEFTARLLEDPHEEEYILGEYRPRINNEASDVSLMKNRGSPEESLAPMSTNENDTIDGITPTSV